MESSVPAVAGISLLGIHLFKYGQQKIDEGHELIAPIIIFTSEI